MTQLAIDFDALPRARTSDPPTSHAAARSAAPFAPEHRTRIYDALTRPMTCYEIGAVVGLDHVAVARRMKELVDANKVRDSESVRPGPNGRACIVWQRVE